MFEQVTLSSGIGHRAQYAACAGAGELGAVALVTILMAFSGAVPAHLSRAAIPLFLAPPPVPAAAPAPPAAQTASRPHETSVFRPVPKTFIAPVTAPPLADPQHAIMVADAESVDLAGGGVPGGVPGGISGGVPGGMLGGFVGGLPIALPSAVPVPPRPAAPAHLQVQVGGEKEAGRLVHQVEPVYPVLARKAHIAATVVLSAMIGPDGNVKELQVVSGNPLFIPATLDAVKQWTYRPTYLNGQAVEVVTEIAVRFRLI